MYNRKIVASVSLIAIVGLLLVGTLPVTRGAQFVLASWDYPDEYGQGISGISISQNISGWVPVTPWGWGPNNEKDVFVINYTATGIKITVWCELNNTVVGADSFDDGKNYLRHSVNITIVGDRASGTIFSKENFTYLGGTDLDPMFYYIYDVDIPLSVVGGLTYKAVVHYEIYW